MARLKCIRLVVTTMFILGCFINTTFGAKKTNLQRCFGPKFQSSNFPSSSQREASSFASLNCYSGSCPCWSSSDQWQVGSGKKVAKAGVRRCFGKSALSPDGSIIFAQSTNEAENTQSHMLSSCTLRDVQSMTANVETYLYSSRLEICTITLLKTESCQPLQSGSNSVTLINERTDGPVQVFLRADEFMGKKGGLAAVKKMTISGQNFQTEPEAPKSFKCTGDEYCSDFAFPEEFVLTDENYGVFVNEVPTKDDGQKFYAAKLDPKQKSGIQIGTGSSFMKGNIEMDAYTSTKDLYIQLCYDSAFIDCGPPILGTSDVTIDELVWQKRQSPVQETSELYLVCSNDGYNIGYCGIDNVEFTSDV